MTLATLLEQVEVAALTEPRRREIASGIRTVCRVLRAEPHLLPATTAELRPRIRNALPAAVRVSSTRWRNAKSLLRQALALNDPAALPARSSGVLTPIWHSLLRLPVAEPVCRGLARFSRWSSLNGVHPADMTQEIFERFHDDLAEHCLLRSPLEAQQTAGHAWNKAVDTVPGWPALKLVMVSQRRNPSLPWSAFPPSLEQSVETYLTARGKPDEIRFDQDQVTFRPTTVITKRAELRQFATAIVQGGVAAESLSSLADLVTVENAWIGLTVLFERAGKQKTGRNHAIACLLLALARYEVKALPDVIGRLSDYCADLAPKKTGMTQKNRRRLRQFDDPRQLDLLLSLPTRLMEAACCVKEPTKGEALTAQMAVAIEILVNAPLRISNIAALEIGRTLILSEKTGLILMGRDEVKNDADLEVPLPATAVAMIRTYLKHFHPILAPAGCLMLFPSRDGSHKRPVSLSIQLSERIRRECGLEFNAHLFRHFAARLFLHFNQGAYGVVMLLLGHKSIQTTMQAYCGTETDAAFRSYSKMISERRDTPGVPTSPRTPARIDSGTSGSARTCMLSSGRMRRRS